MFYCDLTASSSKRNKLVYRTLFVEEVTQLDEAWRGKSFGNMKKTSSAHNVQMINAPKFIQKKLSKSRMTPPAMAPANDPALVDTCNHAKSRVRCATGIMAIK